MVLKVVMEVAVAATSIKISKRHLVRSPCRAFLLLFSGCLHAGVLPEDRADALYHSYDGGGVTIDGPSLLVLKKVGQNVALTGNYYVDSISSASIDVVATASPYAEDRTEVSGGIDYLRGNSIMSLAYTNSNEDDYEADTASLGISMDMFGNMTTVNLGYARGWDTVGDNTDSSFERDVDRQNYQLGVTQVLTPDMTAELNYEGITDEGFLNNPYRSVRYVDPGNANGYSYESEIYPNTRTSNAVALRSDYYLSWRAALSGEYRFFSDTWGIDAHTASVGYTHPLKDGWMLETSYRYYTQDAADFYSDLFPTQGAQNFLARDKELSTFTSNSIGFNASYDFLRNGWHGIDRGSLNLAYNHIWFDYDDFRDVRVVAPVAGTEPLYSFDADVVQFFVSAWF